MAPGLTGGTVGRQHAAKINFERTRARFRATITTMSDRNDIDCAAMKERLQEMKAELARLAHEHEHDSDVVELDQTTQGRLSRMDALQGQAMAQEVARRRDLEIRRIDAALQRIEDGEYGYCVTCGEKIAQKRLELDPATPNCIDCARGEES